MLLVAGSTCVYLMGEHKSGESGAHSVSIRSSFDLHEVSTRFNRWTLSISAEDSLLDLSARDRGY